MQSPGKNATEAYLEEMMEEAPGPINFTMFLTMFGGKLNGTDPEDVIKNAFACFDEVGKGKSRDDRKTVRFVYIRNLDCLFNIVRLNYQL